MSHYVYLNASSLPRMPEGRAGEWPGFWADARPELEAKNEPPLLWLCLFGAADLRWAKWADEPDADDPEGEAFPAGEQDAYPYLVTEIGPAVRRLAGRREAVLAAIGQRYAAAYDGFAALIGQDFAPCILLRTADLPDAGGMGPALSRMVGEMDALDAGAAPGPWLAATVAAFHRWEREDPLWLLGGAGGRGVWPTPALALAYPARRPVPGGGAPVGRDRARAEGVLEWLAALVTAGAGLAAYGLTSSVVLGALAFIACAALTVWLLLRRG